MDLRLMIPGPVPLSSAVRDALATASQAHYGQDWVAIWNTALAMLAELFGTQGDVFNIAGTGSAGLDAAIGSLLNPGDRVLVSTNGFHGDRLAQIAAHHRADVVRIEAPWGEPVLPRQFEVHFRSRTPVKAVLVTHVETTTGVMNPIQDIAALARKYDALVLVDAVASLGGTPIYMDAWGVDLCCSASQKCLGAPAGMAQIAVGERAWQAIQMRTDAPRSWYLDLATLRDFRNRWPDWHPFPTTVPTQLTLALRAALEELRQDGIAKRASHYIRIKNYIRDRARRSDVKLLVEDEWAAPVVTALALREAVADELIAYLADNYQIKVGAGFGPLHGRAIRIGHMSPTLHESDVDILFTGIDAFLSNTSSQPG